MKKIGLILILIIILPIAFLLVNELGKLSENEKVLEQIYNNQLQAILFSVNQYSEDVVRSTANTIISNTESSSTDNAEEKNLNLILDENKKFTLFFVTDSINSDNIRFYFRKNEIQPNIDSLSKYYRKILLQNDSIINKLYTYREQGYIKIEPIQLPESTNESLLIFTDSNNYSKRIYGMVINPQDFITQTLSSRLQEVAKNEFIISVINPKTGYQFNSTKDFKRRTIQAQKALWIFPDYNLGISLVGKSIEELVTERAMNNLILI